MKIIFYWGKKAFFPKGTPEKRGSPYIRVNMIYFIKGVSKTHITSALNSFIFSRKKNTKKDYHFTTLFKIVLISNHYHVSQNVRHLMLSIFYLF